MNTPSKLRPQNIDAPKKGIKWETVKTIVITAFIFGALGLVGGYFTSIAIHENARGNVVQDMQVVKDQK